MITTSDYHTLVLSLSITHNNLQCMQHFTGGDGVGSHYYPHSSTETAVDGVGDHYYPHRSTETAGRPSHEEN